MDNNSVLVMNVGTGIKEENNHSSYIDVVKKAIDTAGAYNIVLIYSQNEVSEQIVGEICEDYNETYHIDKHKLPNKGMEFNFDACYKEYDELLRDYAEKHIILDVTHGTKAMSAALYAVGLHYDVRIFQYSKKTENSDGDFVAGAETIEIFEASYARWRGIFKQCRTLFASRQYEAVKDIVSNEKCPKNLKREQDSCILLSEFCAAWDRLDYETARKNIVTYSIPVLNYRYDPETENTLDILTQKFREPDDKNGEVLTKQELSENIKYIIYLMFDLYANGLRRLEDAQYEDAEVRAYRMAEMLGQIHLMKAGYMSNHMSKSDEQVLKYADSEGIKISPESDIYEPFGRKKVIKFLDFIHYDNAIVKYLQETEDKVKKRNSSILIHGYKATAISPPELKNLFDSLVNKVRYFITNEEFDKMLRGAMFLNNNFKAENNE